MARVDLSRLGLRPSDLLRRTRVFVLVEGEHDRIIIEQVCREQLNEARAHVIPMRGAGQLPITVDSQVLFDFTDAHVVAVLDNVDLAAVETAWSAAQRLAQQGSVDQAVDFVRTHLRAGPQEYAWLRSWLTRALRTGRHNRLTPLGLAAGDVLEYLPVGELVPGDLCSWERLRAQYAAGAAQMGVSRRRPGFKEWLRTTHNADLSLEAISRAARALPEVPQELLKLGYRIRMAALSPPPPP